MPRDDDGRRTLTTEAAREERAADLVRELASADHNALRARWQAVFGNPPPLRSRADFLARALAYQARSELLGGADRVRRRLARLARGDVDPGVRAALRLK